MRREWLLSIGAVVLAFLASQHHNLMLLLSVALGGAGMSSMTGVPLIRRAMLLMSLAMVAVIAYRMRDSKLPRSMRIAGAVSIVVTLGLAAWSVARLGL
jgi:hypothetical protein